MAGLVARGRRLLQRLEVVESYHARDIAERLWPTWNAATCTIVELLERPLPADGDALVRRLRLQLESRTASRARGSAAEATVCDLLRADRERAVDALEELADALDRAHDEWDPADRGGADREVHRTALAAAAAIVTMLDLRVLAERAIDAARADVLEAERSFWSRAARDLAAAGVLARPEEARWPAPARRGPRLRPLARRVTLVVAREPPTLWATANLLEDAGAATILAHSESSALELLRFFHVDAIVCALEGAHDPLVGVPERLEGAWRPGEGAPRRPLLLSMCRGGLDVGRGFDAALPLDEVDALALTSAIGLAMDAHQRSASHRTAER